MKKGFLPAMIIAVFSVLCADAQTHNGVLAFDLGASVNYYYGMGSRNFGKFENDRVNWQIDGMLGLTIARDRAERRTIIGAFGSFGFNNNQTLTELLDDQQYTTSAGSQASSNNFYQIEGGIIIADLIRISTGVGQQNFNTQALLSSNGLSLSSNALKYNSTTVGVRVNVCPILALHLDCNFAYGQDFNKTVIVPKLGLNFRL